MPSKETIFSKQAIFQFDKQTELLLENYIISETNFYAVKLVQQWPQWKDNIAIIYGAEKSGKSHLAKIWQQHAQAAKLQAKELEALSVTEILQAQKHFLIEDVSSISNETALFHLFNAVREDKDASMLITAHAHPNQLGVTLADLRSRLISCELAELSLPDEALFRMLLVKHFSDHQLHVSTEVIEFIINRCERSYAAAANLVESLDNLALTHKRNITIPFIKEMAPQLGLEG